MRKFNFRKILLLGAIVMSNLTIVALIALLYFTATLPIIPTNVGQTVTSSTKIYDRTGKVLLYEVGLRQDIIPLEEMSMNVRNAVIASEDSEFYQHFGISITGILRSVFLDITNQNLSYGGSTITQQLARNLFLTRERTLQRKIREILLAFQLEQKLSKDEILSIYLNTVNFGEGNYGVEAASKYYFSKSAKDLSTGESAALVSIIKSPANRTPVKDPAGTIARRDVVLKKMLDLRMITQSEYDSETKKDLGLNINPYRVLAPHFSLAVLDKVEEMFPEINLSQAGLKVTTTLDYSLQEKAEQFVLEGAGRNKINYQGNNAALVAMDPRNGEVLSMVGSKDFFDETIDGQVNVTMQKRQPGSSFKPIIYSLLFEKGYPDKTTVFDLPTNFGTENDPYTPQNFSGKFQGPITVRNALAQSINVPSVKVAYLVGIDNIINRAKDFGLTTVTKESQAGLAIGLGVIEVKPLELVRAYSAFSQDGRIPSYSLIKNVSDKNGNSLFEYEATTSQAVSPNAARMITNILSDNEARAPLFGAGSLLNFPGYAVAAKTGTSQDFRDAWAIGYTNDIVIGVWAGNNDGTAMVPGSGGILASVPIMHNLMVEHLKESPNFSFEQPEFISSSKPMLNGQYVNMINGQPQIHDLLYYVNKDDPFGPIPSNPNNDAQFARWETPLAKWLIDNYSLLQSNITH